MEFSNKYFTEYLRELKRVEIGFQLKQEGTTAILTYNGFATRYEFIAFLSGIQYNLQLEVQNNLFQLNKNERFEYLKRMDFEIIELSKHLSAVESLFDEELSGELSHFDFYYYNANFPIFSYLNISILMPDSDVKLLTTIQKLKEYCTVQWEFYEMFGASYLVDIIQNEGINILEMQNKIHEILPDFKYKTEAQKISWLYELGILECILKICKNGETYNWRNAGNIIHSFTGINAETARKMLQAIYQENEGNKKNNPLNNPENKLFVTEMSSKFKLNKDR